MLPKIEPHVREHYRGLFLSTFRTKDDLRKQAILEYSIDLPNLSLAAGNATYQIDKFVLRYKIDRQLEDRPIKHTLIPDKALLSSGRFDDLTFTLVQASGTSKIKLFATPIKPNIKKKAAKSTNKATRQNAKRDRA
jgi:hypothetical protein